MQILNRKNIDAWPPGSIYIGRGTVFGNPYVIGEHGDRDQVCEQYADRLQYMVSKGDPAMLTALLGLKADSSLVCSCAPSRCHGTEIERAWRLLAETGLPPRKPSMAYAGIGSRKTPARQLERMTAAAKRLAAMGYTLRSGAADGADKAFEAGAGEKKQIFLPWGGFNGSNSPFAEPSREAKEVAAALHPAWTHLPSSVKNLHARNSHQILGEGLRTPCDFVVCWTPDGAETEAERSKSTGGTGQAIALASRWGIPVFNFAKPDAGERLLKRLQSDRQKVGCHPGIQIQERRGNILDAPVRALVNPVNTQGVMGKGLALKFKQRFPDAFEDYRQACSRGELKPGVLHTFRLDDGRWIVNFPTKTAWQAQSKLEYIDSGLPVLVDFVRTNGIESIAIPALGCGLGALPWHTVKPRIEKAFRELSCGYVNVWLFAPQGK